MQCTQLRWARCSPHCRNSRQPRHFPQANLNLQDTRRNFSTRSRTKFPRSKTCPRRRPCRDCLQHRRSPQIPDCRRRRILRGSLPARTSRQGSQSRCCCRSKSTCSRHNPRTRCRKWQPPVSSLFLRRIQCMRGSHLCPCMCLEGSLNIVPGPRLCCNQSDICLSGTC